MRIPLRSSRLHAHFWTVWPHVSELWRGAEAAGEARAWEHVVHDSAVGDVRLSGLFSQGKTQLDGGGAQAAQSEEQAAQSEEQAAAGGARGTVVVLHGLGGDPGSSYCRAAARGFVARGFDVLNLAMRGADGQGEDVYHGGLCSDLASVVDRLVRETDGPVFVCGFSVGGHVALRLATEPDSPLRRPHAVVAICPPLDLAVARVFIDEFGAAFYRRRVVAGLRSGFAELRPDRQIAVRGVMSAAAVRSVWDWDSTVIVPRFGFASPEHYYASESVAPRLKSDLAVPAMVVVAEHDPIVPAHVIEPSVRGVPGLDVRRTDRGGHLGFPASLDLGLGEDPGLAGQLSSWFGALAKPDS